MPEKVTVRFKNEETRTTDGVKVSVKKGNDTDPVHVKVKSNNST